MATDPHVAPAPPVLVLNQGDLLIEVHKGPPITVVATIFGQSAVMSEPQWLDLVARTAQLLALARSPQPFTPPYPPGVVPRFVGTVR